MSDRANTGHKAFMPGVNQAYSMLSVAATLLNMLIAFGLLGKEGSMQFMD
eukprot:COSAG02_NODE_6203_length_3732_cov_1.726122_1_plen_50_part_00